MNYKKAKDYFERYLNNNFDTNNEKIKHKINHTYKVVENTKYICNSLKLNNEIKELALIIALLHDIGRFTQAKEIESFREDINSYDHASLGIKILFEQNEITNYIEDKKYYDIIKKSIENHSKYILDETNMTEKELLHSKILRDADKIDSFRAKTKDDIYTMANITKEDIENSIVTKKVYDTFKSHQTILSKDRITGLDIWLSYIAFIFGLEYKASYELIQKEDYLNKLFNRYKYKKDKETMDELKKEALNYLNKKINK